MNAGTQKCQMVIAIFSDPSAFVSAVAHLLDAGLSFDKICYAALAQTFERVPSPALAELNTKLPEFDLLAAANCDGDDKIIGVCGKAWTAEPLPIDASVPSCIPASMESHIRNGAIVLTVSPATTDQQQAAIRILLSHSSEHVETRDSRRGQSQHCAERALHPM